MDKSKDGKFKQITGECSFCGQQRMLTVSADADEENIRMAAVLSCGCQQALHYQQKTRRIRSAQAHVDSLFGAGAGDNEQDAQVVGIMKRGIELIDGGWIKSFTIELYDGMKCRMAVMKNDEIKVSRTIKAEVELKA